MIKKWRSKEEQDRQEVRDLIVGGSGRRLPQGGSPMRIGAGVRSVGGLAGEESVGQWTIAQECRAIAPSCGSALGRSGRALRPQNTTSGLTGEPVPPSTGSGAKVIMNS